jgi:hypothetical protein
MKKGSKTIAYIIMGHSQYDDEVWGLVQEFNLDTWCSEYDHLDMMDCFILAGASVNTNMSKYGDPEVTLTIPKGRVEFEGFLWRLRKRIKEKIRIGPKRKLGIVVE